MLMLFSLLFAMGKPVKFLLNDQSAEFQNYVISEISLKMKWLIDYFFSSDQPNLYVRCASCEVPHACHASDGQRAGYM